MGCSYTWRSIIQGLQVLRDAVIWRVGNGQQINMWSDPWVPREVTRLPITPKGSTMLQRVDELINPVTEQWDTQLLYQCFWEEDVKLIRSLPVHVQMEDTLAWHYDKKGVFSVRSAYKVHRAGLQRNQFSNKPGGSESSHGTGDFWKKLWKIECPPKVKHFLWRLSHNTLALRVVLQRRGLKLDSRCCMCERLDENGGHLFFECKFVKEAWAALNLDTVRCDLSQAATAMDMMERIMKLEPTMQAKVVLLIWLWWGERNRWREEGRRRPGVDVAYVAAAIADRKQQPEIASPLSNFCQKPHWKKPAQTFIKINTDGAFVVQTGEGGWGFVIRDSDGGVWKAGGGKELYLHSAFHAELLGCLEGLKMAVSMGMMNVVLETDAANVRTALEGDEFQLSPMRTVIMEIKHLMVLKFNVCKVSVCPRECNKLAHELASLGCKLPSGNHAAWDDVPPSLEGLVSSDLAVTEE